MQKIGLIWILLHFSLVLWSNSSTPNPSSINHSTTSTYTPVASSNENKNPEEVRETMKQWSRQLGVTCTHCHNLDNFKDDAKPFFKISLKHKQMVKVLQEEVFSERDKGNVLKVKVDCYMCHRGKEIPAYLEPPAQLTK